MFTRWHSKLSLINASDKISFKNSRDEISIGLRSGSRIIYSGVVWLFGKAKVKLLFMTAALEFQIYSMFLWLVVDSLKARKRFDKALISRVVLL